VAGKPPRRRASAAVEKAQREAYHDVLARPAATRLNNSHLDTEAHPQCAVHYWRQTLAWDLELMRADSQLSLFWEPISREEKMSMPAGSRQRSLMTEFRAWQCRTRWVACSAPHCPHTHPARRFRFHASSLFRAVPRLPKREQGQRLTASSIRPELSLQSLLCTPSRRRRLDPNPGIRSRKKQTLATVNGARTASLGPPPPPGITPKKGKRNETESGELPNLAAAPDSPRG